MTSGKIGGTTGTLPPRNDVPRDLDGAQVAGGALLRAGDCAHRRDGERGGRGAGHERNAGGGGARDARVCRAAREHGESLVWLDV